MSNPSQSEANKMLRVLQGEPQKYTVRVDLPGLAEPVEFQTRFVPQIIWDIEARCLWLKCRVSATYPDTDPVPVMAWPEGAILRTELNPGWKDPE